MPIDTREAYDAAMVRLREHVRDCNCFLPNMSCLLPIKILKQECSDFYLDKMLEAGQRELEASRETAGDASGSAS